jgi:hypothetical protein
MESISLVRSGPLVGNPPERYATAVEGQRDAIGARLHGMERGRVGSAYRLDKSPVLKESRLILDVIARYPCLDLISESL